MKYLAVGIAAVSLAMLGIGVAFISEDWGRALAVVGGLLWIDVTDMFGAKE